MHDLAPSGICLTKVKPRNIFLGQANGIRDNGKTYARRDYSGGTRAPNFTLVALLVKVSGLLAAIFAASANFTLF